MISSNSEAIYGLCFHHRNLNGYFCLNVLRTMIRIFVSAHELNTFSSRVMCFIRYLEVQWIGRAIVSGARTHINRILIFSFSNCLWIICLFVFFLNISVIQSVCFDFFRLEYFGFRWTFPNSSTQVLTGQEGKTNNSYLVALKTLDD